MDGTGSVEPEESQTPDANVITETVPVKPSDEKAEGEAGKDEAKPSTDGEQIVHEYATWADVAAAIEEGELEGENMKPAGAGTQDDPYAISTPEALAWWARYKAADQGTFARLDADIDLTAATYVPRERAREGEDPDGEADGEAAAEEQAPRSARDDGEGGKASSPVESGRAAGGEESGAVTAPTLWMPIEALAAELDGQGHSVLFRTEGAGFAETVAESGAVRWLSLGRTRAQLDAAAAEGGEAATLAETSVETQGPRAGSVAGTNLGTIVGVVNRMPVSWQSGDAPAASALVGGIAGENRGRIADCANLGEVANASAAPESAAAGIAAAGAGSVETSYSAASVKAATNGAYLTTTLTAEAPYEDLVDEASCYLAPGNDAAYDGIVVSDRPGALSPEDLRDAAERLNNARAPAASPWSAGEAATNGYPAPSRPANPDATPNTLSASNETRAATATYKTWAEVANVMYDAALSKNITPGNRGTVDVPARDGTKTVELPSYNQNLGGWQVSTPEQLAFVAYLVNTENARYATRSISLWADIDLSGKDYVSSWNKLEDSLVWAPIGCANAGGVFPFAGGLNGHNYEVDYLYVDAAQLESGTSRDGAGLIGRIKQVAVTIENVGIGANSSVIGGMGMGGIVGIVVYNASDAPSQFSETITFRDCYNKASIVSTPQNASFDANSGGILGYGDCGRFVFERCYNQGSVRAERTNNGYRAFIGGIAGVVRRGTFTDCYNTGDITAWEDTFNNIGIWPAGGIVGHWIGNELVDGDGCKMTNCYNVGRITNGMSFAGFDHTSATPDRVDWVTNSYYLEGNACEDKLPYNSHKPKAKLGTSSTQTQLQSQSMADTLNGNRANGDAPWRWESGANDDYPILEASDVRWPDWYTVANAIDLGLIVASDGSSLVPALNADGLYVIRNPEGLAWYSYYVEASVVDVAAGLRGAVITAASLDMSGTPYGGTRQNPLPFFPIGNSYERGAAPLRDVTFDGGGCVIDNLLVEGPQDASDTGSHTVKGSYTGLFGQVLNATVKGVHLGSNCTVKGYAEGSDFATAGVVGMTLTSRVLDCSFAGAIIGYGGYRETGYFGGIVGRADRGESVSSGSEWIARCAFTGALIVEGGTYYTAAGGVAGYVSDSYSNGIEDCYATGSIGGADLNSWPAIASGIVAACADYSQTSAKRCYTTGDVHSSISLTNAYAIGPDRFSRNIAYLVDDGSGSFADATSVTRISSSAAKESGFVDALNDGRLGDAAVWDMDSVQKPVNYGYPVLKGSAPKFASWAEVGAAVEDGTLGEFKPGGTGAVDSPYEITTPEALAWFAFKVNTDREFGKKSAKLMNNIDLHGETYTGEKSLAAALPWDPIGKDDAHWYGADAASSGQGDYQSVVFDGNKKTVDYLKVDVAGDYAGLLGAAHNCTVKNVTVGQNSSVAATGKFVGGVVGGFNALVSNAGYAMLVENCINRASVKGSNRVGGVAGSVPRNPAVDDAGGAIVRCGNYGSVTLANGSKAYAGGVVGWASANKVTQCFNEGSLSFGSTIFGMTTGGISGWGGKVSSCYNAGTMDQGEAFAATDGSDWSVDGDSCLYLDTTGGTAQGIKVTADGLKSWAAAYALNGGKVGASSVWAVKSGKNPAFGKLRAASDWSEVGYGVKLGLISGALTGSGTTASPWTVSSPEGLAHLAYVVNQGEFGSKNYTVKLSDSLKTDGLDLSGAQYVVGTKNLKWIPIGTSASDSVKNTFQGSFDGNDVEIKNMRVEGSSSLGAGLFGTAHNATIENVVVGSSCSIQASNNTQGAGGVLGIAEFRVNVAASVILKNCTNAAKVSGSTSSDSSFAGVGVGGILGYSDAYYATSLVIEGCSNTGEVNNSDDVTISYNLSAGGIVGYVRGGRGGEKLDWVSVASCSNEGFVKGVANAGGVVGCIDSWGPTVQKSWNKGVVDGSTSGGIVGRAQYSITVADCYNRGAIGTNTASASAGIVYSSNTDTTNLVSVSNCYNAAKVTALGVELAWAIANPKKLEATNCYFASDMGGVYPDQVAVSVKGALLRTWGAARALNGDRADGCWTYDPEVNEGFPSYGTLGNPGDWGQVGAAVEAGFIGDKPTKGAEGSYVLDSEEDLAWFAYKTNDRTASFLSEGAKITVDTLDLTGAKYGGTPDNKLKWVPIASNAAGHGSKTGNYTGNFDGQGAVIKSLYQHEPNAKGASSWGLFGFLSTGATVQRVQLEDVDINVDVSGWSDSNYRYVTAGGIAGQLSGGTVKLCGVTSGTIVANSPVAKMTGGIVGDVHEGGGTIEDCWSMATVGASGSADTAGGGILGRAYGSNAKVYRSYFAGKAHGNPVCQDGASKVTFVSVLHDSTVQGSTVSMGENVKGLTTDYMKSWAAAYYLNERTLGTGGTPWAYTPGSYPTYGTMTPASDWGDVGLGVDAGLIGSIPIGDGGSDPYLLASPAQLAWFAYKVNTENGTFRTKNAKLDYTLNLAGTDYGDGQYPAGNTASSYDGCLKWIPIGSSENAYYSGTFDGEGWGVTNLCVDGGSRVGLFGSVAGAIIKNCGVDSGSVKGGDYVGGLVGSVVSPGSTLVEGCWNKAFVTASSDFIGGIVGSTSLQGATETVKIAKCRNFGTLSQTNGQGSGGIVGAVGDRSREIIENCFNQGRVTGFERVGGILGGGTASVEGCYNAGELNAKAAKKYVADIAMDGASVSNCYYLEGCNKGNQVVGEGNGTQLTSDQLKSWGAAYALAGGDGKKELSTFTTWRPANDANENGGYPVPCASNEKLRAASDWSEVSAWVDLAQPSSFLPSEVSTKKYEVSSAEALAYMGLLLDRLDADIKVMVSLTDHIDLTGAPYGGTADAPLAWKPFSTYTHGLLGNKHVVSNLSVPETAKQENAGLFGTLSGNASVSQLGVEVFGVTGSSAAGGLAASMSGGAVVDCYVVGSGSGTVSSGSNAAGLIGTMTGGRVINSFAAVLIGGSGTKHAFVKNAGGTVTNCYYDNSLLSSDASGAVGRSHLMMTSPLAAIDLNNGRGTGPWGWTGFGNNGYPLLSNVTAAVENWADVAAVYTERELRNTTVTSGTPGVTLPAGTTELPALSGTGVDFNDALTIASPEALAWFAAKVNANENIGNVSARNAVVKLAASLDLSGTRYGGKVGNAVTAADYDTCLKWTPIGTSSNAYGNDFYGQGHTVKNLHVDWLDSSDTSCAGLFGYVGGQGGVRDLGIESGSVKNAGYAAGVTGVLDGAVERCWSAAFVSSSRSNCGAGGIAGYVRGSVDNCYNLGAVSGSASHKGGIAAVSQSSSTLKNSYNAGQVTGGNAIVSYQYSGTTMSNNYYLDGAGSASGLDASKARKLTADQLASWAAAYGLNGKNFGGSNVWTLPADGANNGYPVLKVFGGDALRAANDWGEVGLGVDVEIISGKPTLSGSTYDIDSAEGLAWAAYRTAQGDSFAGQTLRLTKDIDLLGKTYNGKQSAGNLFEDCLLWKPLGPSGKPFAGTLDGVTHANTISNLRTDETANCQGLVGELTGTVRNLEMASGLVKGTDRVGIVAALVKGGTVQNCVTDFAMGNQPVLVVDGANRVGGIVGEVGQGGATVEKCVNKATVQATGEAGGIVGSAQGAGSVSIKNCANKGSMISAASSARMAGIFGGTDSALNGATVAVSGCYNAGAAAMSSGGKAYGVTLQRSGVTINNSVYTEGTTSADDSKDGLRVSDDLLKTWAAAYYLNGRTIGNLGAWASGDGSDYPTFGSLRAAADWFEVGLGVDAGLVVKTDGSSYKPAPNADGSYDLASEEALAWFAYKTNAADSKIEFMTKNAQVKGEIDLTGERYTGSAAPPLQWVSIAKNGAGHGRTAGNYSGTFDGGGHAIKNLRQSAPSAGFAGSWGLFAFVSGGGTVKNVVLESVNVSAAITGSSNYITVGGVAGQLTGGATVERCAVRSGSVKGESGTEMTGGIVGDVHEGGGTIRNCYVLASVGESADRKKGGGILGRACYASTSGKEVTVTGCYYAGSAAASPLCQTNSRNLSADSKNNYYDSTLLTGAGNTASVVGLKSDDMKSWATVLGLNGGSRTGAWAMDDVSPLKNGGYPVLATGSGTALRAADSWEEVGLAADLGIIADGKPAQDGTSALKVAEISTPEQLAWFAYKVNHTGVPMYAKLTDNINLTGGNYTDAGADPLRWVPIGSYKTATSCYQGTFDGQDRTVDHMRVDETNETGAGLFGAIDSVASGVTTAIKNVGVGANSTSKGNNRAGGVVGVAGSSEAATTITGCWSKAKVTSTASQAGGIVGAGINSKATSDHRVKVERCYNEGSVTASNGYAGGILGIVYAKTSNGPAGFAIENCYNKGAVSVTGQTNDSYHAAGIAACPLDTTVKNCYSSGTLSSKNGTADRGTTYGIGNVSGGSVTNSYYLERTAANAGGGKSLTDAQLKSWAAAYALNDQKLGAAGVWTENGTDYPAFGQLRAANDWGEVGLGVDAEIIGTKPTDVNNIYAVDSPEGLAWVAWKSQTDDFKDKTVLLGESVDLLGKEYTGVSAPGDDFANCLAWKPIGSEGTPFAGMLQGEGNKVSNLRTDATATHQGLVAALTGSVEALTVNSGSVRGQNYVGGIVALVKGAATVYDCSTGPVLSVEGAEYVGGIVGEINPSGATIEKCVNNASVTSNGEAGGIVATAYTSGNTIIKYCANKGAVTSKGTTDEASRKAASGIFARTQYNLNNAKVEIIGCYNVGTVTAESGGQAYGVSKKRPGGITIQNSAYTTNTASADTDNDGLAVSDAHMKTWAAAYYLNGTDLGASSAWFSEGTAYPTFGALRDAAHWGEVGAGVDAGFIGTGAPKATNGVYEVSTPEQLAWVAFAGSGAAETAKNFENETVKLADSITDGLDLTGSQYRNAGDAGALAWQPIGMEQSFAGTLDGNGKTIKSMVVTAASSSNKFGAMPAFVGKADGATIRHLGIEGANVDASGSGTSCSSGALLASAPSCTIVDCYVQGGSVKGKGPTGGMVGSVSTGTFENCYVAIDVSNTSSDTGAFVGKANSGSATNCYYEEGRAGSAADASGAVGRSATGMQSLLLASQLNARRTSDAPWSWAANVNGAYPAFGGTPAKLEKWEDVGRAQDENSLRTAKSVTGGDGSTVESAMELNNADALAWYAFQVNSDAALTGGTQAAKAHVKLGAGIDLLGGAYTGATSAADDFGNCLVWTPIKTFSGSLNGDGKAVQNLRTDAKAGTQGLIGALTAGTVENLAVASGSVRGTNNVGAIAATVGGNSRISGCSTGSGLTVSGDALVGGIVGCDLDGAVRVEKCVNAASVASGGEAGGIVGSAWASGSLSISNCANHGTVKTSSKQTGDNAGKNSAAGIFGRTGFTFGSVAVTIAGCYSAGKVTAEGAGKAYGVTLKRPGITMNNSAYANTTSADSNNDGLAVTDDQLKTWAAAYYLNGRNIGTGTAWAPDAADGYPALAAADGLRPAADWAEVGLGVDAGFIDGKLSPGSDGVYQISSPEQLAWFAYKVNQATANQGWKAALTDNIDLLGKSYTGKADAGKDFADCLTWVPISTFKGTFNGNRKAVSNLQTDRGFIHILSGGTVQDLGIDSGRVSYSEGAVAALVNDMSENSGATVQRCYNKADVIADNLAKWTYVGGVVAVARSGCTVSDCFNAGSITMNKKSDTSATELFVGGVVGYLYKGSVSNCYNVGSVSQAGSATRTRSDMISGVFEGGSPSNCYYDASKKTSANSAENSTGFTEAQMKSWNAAFALNGDKYVGSDGSGKPASTVWTTDDQGVNGGYPVYGNLAIDRLTVSLDPGAISLEPATTKKTSGEFKDASNKAVALTGDVHLLKAPANPSSGSGDAALLATTVGAVDEKFSTWGVDSASGTVALAAGTNALHGSSAVGAPWRTADNASRIATGGLKGLDLHAAAAYLHNADRATSLVLMDDDRAYEVDVTVKAVSTKGLDVTVPVESGRSFDLTPNGKAHTGADAAVASQASTVKNNTAAPVAGRVDSVKALAKDTPLSGTDKVAVQLQSAGKSATLPSPSTTSITEPGMVKLYAAASAGTGGLTQLTNDVWFVPSSGTASAQGNVPLNFALPGYLGTGTAPAASWKWKLDYAGTYLGEDEDAFGFEYTYALGLPKDDVTTPKLSDKAIESVTVGKAG